MGGPTGVGATCGPQYHGDGSSSGNVTTVKEGETSLRKVAERLSKNVDKEYGTDPKEIQKGLEKANPNLKNKVLTKGQDVCLPPKKESSGSKTEKQVGDYVVKPKITPSTDDTYDRNNGTSSQRKNEQDRLDRTRPRDERDLNPKDIQRMKERNQEPHRRVVEDQLRKGLDEAENKGKNNNPVKSNKGEGQEVWDDMMRRNSKYRIRP
jgi:hypothetical protein